MKFRLAAICSILFAGAAQAQALSDAQFYAGADYQDATVSYKSGLGAIAPNLSQGADLHGGVRFGRYYAVEIGYAADTGERTAAIAGIPIDTKVALHGPTLDAYGFLPLFHGPLSLFATGGVSYFSGKATVTAAATTIVGNTSEFGYRFGGGVQFELQDFGNLRATARYQSADFGGVASRAIVYGLGLNFYL